MLHAIQDMVITWWAGWRGAGQYAFCHNMDCLYQLSCSSYGRVREEVRITAGDVVKMRKSILSAAAAKPLHLHEDLAIIKILRLCWS